MIKYGANTPNAYAHANELVQLPNLDLMLPNASRPRHTSQTASSWVSAPRQCRVALSIASKLGKCSHPLLGLPRAAAHQPPYPKEVRSDKEVHLGTLTKLSNWSPQLSSSNPVKYAGSTPYTYAYLNRIQMYLKREQEIRIFVCVFDTYIRRI